MIGRVSALTSRGLEGVDWKGAALRAQRDWKGAALTSWGLEGADWKGAALNCED